MQCVYGYHTASPLNPVLAIHPPGRRCKVVLIGSGPLAGGAGIGWAGKLGEPHWALVPAAGWAAQEGQTDTQRPCAGDRWLVCWLSGDAPAGLSTGARTQSKPACRHSLTCCEFSPGTTAGPWCCRRSSAWLHRSRMAAAMAAQGGAGSSYNSSGQGGQQLQQLRAGWAAATTAQGRAGSCHAADHSISMCSPC